MRASKYGHCGEKKSNINLKRGLSGTMHASSTQALLCSKSFGKALNGISTKRHDEDDKLANFETSRLTHHDVDDENQVIPCHEMSRVIYANELSMFH
jgi:hypothetical protein